MNGNIGRAVTILLAVGATAAMLSTSLSAAGGSAIPQSSGSPGLETIAGFAWSADIRVTESLLTESEPHLRAVPSHGEYVMWKELGTTQNGSYLARLDGLGGLMQGRTMITNRTVPSWGAQFPLGPNVDADPEGNLHVVWEHNYTDIYYQKVDAYGNLLVAEKRIGANDTQSSSTPSVSVARNGSVHIVHEDYKFECEDIFYDRLDIDGNPVLSERAVTGNLNTHSEFSLVKPDPFSSHTFVTLGTQGGGTWLERLASDGSTDMSPVKVRNQGDFKIADVAATPDGDAHLVWEDGTTVYYSRVNATGALVYDYREISTSGRSGAFPHVAAMSDNRTVVVWDDTRSGRSQIMIAILNDTSFGAGGAPAAIALTASSGTATQPWVEVDETDEIHVAWIDDRDGPPEVYYKRAYTCKVGISANPAGLAELLALGPGQSATVPVSVRNGGYLSDHYGLELLLNETASARGWSAQLSVNTTPPLLAGQNWPANVTVWAPLNATDNDTASFAFSASSANIANCLSMNSYGATVHVRRSLHLDAAINRASAHNGEAVSFGFTVTNAGDAREDKVLLSGTPDDPRWLLDLLPGQVALDPDANDSGSLTVLVPAERTVAAGDSTFHVRISATSSADPRFGATLDLWIDVIPELELTIRALDPTVTALPGEVLRINFAVEATGNVEPTVRFSASEPHYAAGDPFAPFSLGSPSVRLTFGASFRLYLGLTVPLDAVAGTVYVFNVVADAPEYGKNASAQSQVVVALVCGLSFGATDTETVSGGSLPIELQVSNAGNGDQAVEIEFIQLPKDWAPSASAGGPTRVTAAAFTYAEASLTVDASATAVAGLYRVTLQATSADCGAVEASANVRIKEQTGFTISVDEAQVSTRPGETAVFVVHVTSLANIPQTYAVAVAHFSRQITFWMNASAAPDQVPPPLFVGGNLTLGPFGTATIRVHVYIPQKTTDEVVTMTFEAYGEAKVHKSVGLSILVLHPDLQVVDVEVEGPPPQAGDPSVIAVTVENTGGDTAPAVTVALIIDGKRVGTLTASDFAAGENQTFRFNWTPTAGSHTIQVEIQSEGGAPEVILGNNDGVLGVTAKESPAVVVAAEPPTFLLLVFLLAGAGAIVALALAHRRRNAGPPEGG